MPTHSLFGEYVGASGDGIKRYLNVSQLHFTAADHLEGFVMPAPVFVGSKFLIEEAGSISRLAKMAALADGGFVAVWLEQGRDLRIQTFGADGTPKSAEAGIPLSIGTQWERLSLAVLKDGGYVATWESYDEIAHGASVMGAVFNSDGSLRKSTFQISKDRYDNERKQDIAALDDGGFMVVYDHRAALGDPQYSVVGRTFSANGTLVKDEFLVNATTTGAQFMPRVTALQNGTIAAAYCSESAIHVRLLQADGSPVPSTSEIILSSSTGSYTRPTLTTLSDGRFVAVWEASNGQGTDILAQIFSANGSKVGDQTIVNTTIFGSRARAQISALQDGGFAIVFEVSVTNPTGDVRVATFDAAGNRYGNDLLVHSSTAGDQKRPDIITLADGRFVVTWTDADGSIAGQVLRQDLNLTGTDGADTLKGGPGNDTLDGGDGTDRLYGGAGEDDLRGGPGGYDVADYSSAKSAVVIDLVTPENSSGEAKGDIYSGIEVWFGSAFNDTITAANQAWELWGHDGNDVVRAGSGTTFLHGGSGDDTLEGGAEGDYLIGGAGFDLVSYENSDAAVTVSLTGTGSAAGGHAEGDLFVSNGEPSLSVEGIIGSAFADTLTGSATVGSYLDGAAERDKLQGGSGNDTLIGGTGNDTLDGGSGTDAALFSGTRAQSTITRNPDGTVTVAGPDGIDLIENVRFLQFDDGMEALTNTAPTGLSLSSNLSTVENAPIGAVVGTLSAADADGDAIRYSLAPGSSSAFGIRGNSLVVIGPLDFETMPTHQVTIQAGDDYGGVTSLTVNLTVTNAIETTPFTIRGTSRAETLTGEAGHDTISGSAGNDRLYGGLGNDRLHGGTGNDRLYGQGGKDIFVFDTKPHKSTNVDRIEDFNVRDNSIWLDNKVFTKLGSGTPSKPKKFKSDMFVKNTKTQDAEDRIVYDKKTGALYYDQDGTGAKAQVKIATLTKNLALTYNDFYVI